MRSLSFLLAVLLAASVHAVTSFTSFVSPQAGSQAIGPMAIEVTTTATAVDRVDFLVDGVLAGVARTPPYRIAFDFGTTLEAREVTAKVWTNGFADSEVTSIRTAALTAGETVHVDLVEIPLRVQASRTIDARDLSVRENGVVQTIRDVKHERPDARFAFIVDRSLSMGGGKLEAALAAARSSARQLRPGDSALLVVFNHNVSPPQAIERGHDLPATHLQPSGGTSLRDALASIASRDRTYAIVITDGGDRNSILSDEEALRRISGTRTIVNAIVMGGSHASFLDRAAANTGGTVVTATKETVARAVEQILADINSRYLVVYQSHGTRNGWRTIDVRPNARGIRIVSARKGYFAE